MGARFTGSGDDDGLALDGHTALGWTSQENGVATAQGVKMAGISRAEDNPLWSPQGENTIMENGLNPRRRGTPAIWVKQIWNLFNYLQCDLAHNRHFNPAANETQIRGLGV